MNRPFHNLSDTQIDTPGEIRVGPEITKFDKEGLMFQLKKIAFIIYPQNDLKTTQELETIKKTIHINFHPNRRKTVNYDFFLALRFYLKTRGPVIHLAKDLKTT